MQSQGKDIVDTTSCFTAARTDSNELKALIQSLAPRKTLRPLVRIGPKGDGGYLVPDHLEGIYALFSPGVSNISGFEMDCALRGMKVFMADRSVERPVESHINFTFTKKHVGSIDDDDHMTLDSWIGASLPQNFDGDLALQMDIEGAEYESIISASTDLLRSFRIIVIEFHCLHHLWCRPYFEIASKAFTKLLKFHSCVHIHPNNYCGSVAFEDIEIPIIAEFTFLRNDCGVLDEWVDHLPHELDEDNTTNLALRLHHGWLRRH
jgi:hypothetical protein